MSKERMLQAKALIQQKRYDEAYEILITVDHPKAEAWMAKIEQMSGRTHNAFANPSHDPFDGAAPASAASTYTWGQPEPEDSHTEYNYGYPFGALFPEEDQAASAASSAATSSPTQSAPQKSMSGEFIFYALIGIIGLAIVVIAAMFLLPRLLVVEDLSGCGAQDWWGEAQASLDPLYTLMLNAGSPERLGNLVDLLNTVRNGREVYRTVTYPACAQAAHQAMLAVYDNAIEGLRIYDVTNWLGSTGAFRRAVADARAAEAQLAALNIQMRGSDASFFDQVSGECPALAWTMEVAISDEGFFQVAFEGNSAFENFAEYRLTLQVEIRRLSEVPTPSCLETARQSLVAAAESFKGAFDAAYGNDVNGIYFHIENYDTHLNNYENAMSGVGFPVVFDDLE